MPEGHTIHRHARLQRKILKGQPISAWSPQGRFDEGAARLDGQVCTDIEANGKHLFYRWDGGDILHVHLGLFGRFRTFHDAPPDPTAGTRLALKVRQGDGQGSTIYLAGATIVDLITEPEVEEIASRLGPDPLRRDADPSRFVAALRRRSTPIVEALLDQKAVCGIGNVYRSELLYRAAMDPDLPARDVTESEAMELWEDTVHLLTLGERSGRIVTVEPEDVGKRRRSSLTRGEQRYVYKRHDRPCHRCGTPIIMWAPRDRLVWACPSCQPLSRTATSG